MFVLLKHYGTSESSTNSLLGTLVMEEANTSNNAGHDVRISEPGSVLLAIAPSRTYHQQIDPNQAHGHNQLKVVRKLFSTQCLEVG